MKKHYFTRGELALWLGSLALIIAAFCIWDRTNFLTLAASLVGVTSLIFCAKGNPLGQVLILLFSALYGVISWYAAYYGEMITYLGMTAPMAVYALIVWLKHPYKGNRAQVSVNRLRAREYLFMAALAAAAELGGTDYGAIGVGVIAAMYLLRERPLAAYLISLVLLALLNMQELCSIPAFLALALYNGKRGRQPKYFFYVFYPAHLLLLWMVGRFVLPGIV